MQMALPAVILSEAKDLPARQTFGFSRRSLGCGLGMTGGAGTGNAHDAEAPSTLAIIGRYILTPAIFDCLARTQTGAGGELQLTDGMRMLLKQEKMYAYVYEGKRYDTGDKLGFLKATVEFALARPDLADAFRAYLKGLTL